MTLKTSFIDFGIIKHNLKRYWWVSAISFAVMFIATILRIVLTDLEYYIERVQKFPDRAGDLLYNDAGIMILIPTASVLIAICVLRYLQSPRSATLMHSLPPKRTALFTSAFISGIILFAAPVILSAVILTVLSAATQYGLLFTIPQVMRWCGIFLLYGLAFYSFAMFAGVFTGSSIAQFVFTYILLALPFGIVALCTVLFNGWLYAFVAQTASPVFDTLLKVLPFHYPMAVSAQAYESTEVWQYFLMGGYIAVCYAAGLFFYTKRNIEQSGDVVAFRFVKPVFLYGVTVCCSLAGAALIKGIRNTSDVSLISLICFGLIGYIVAKMLLLKSFRILKYYKGAIVFICAAVLFWTCVTFNTFGFGKSTPDADDVAKAYIGTYLNANWLDDDLKISHYGYSSQNVVFTQKENIEALIKLQQNAIDGLYPQKVSNDVYDSEFYDSYTSFCISYKLKSGRTLTREYILGRDDVSLLLSAPEAKDYMFPYVRTMKHTVDFIRVANERFRNGEQEHFTVSTDEEKALLIEALTKDIDTLSYDELFTYSRDMPLHAEFTLDIEGTETQDSAYMQINKYFENTIAYMAEYHPEFLDGVYESADDVQPEPAAESVTSFPAGEMVTVTPIY